MANHEGRQQDGDGEHCLQEQVYLALAIYVPEIRFCDLPTEGTSMYGIWYMTWCIPGRQPKPAPLSSA